MRERIGVGVAWAAGLVAPAIALGHAPHGVAETATWILGCAASLILWIAVVDGLAQLRGRAPAFAWPLAALVALVLPLWIVGANRYFVAMHGCLPPSAVWFGCRNPRYAYVLALEATTPRERALVVAAPLLLLALLHVATRRAPPPSPWWRARVRAVAVAVALVLVILPRAPRPPDLEALRATVGGVGMFLAHARPELGRPARLRPSALPPAVERPNIVLVVQESLGAAAWAPWNRRPDSSPRIAELLAEDAAQAEWFGDAVSAAGATAVSLPTIVTGLPPDASGDEFRRAPLLWQEARALGYRTALVSAQSYDWLGFREVFPGADAPDVARTAAELGGPRVNDNGVDDARAVDEAIRFIDATPRARPFLVVVQLNATHRPCWAPDAATEPLEAGRCALAARYVDDVALRLVDHLRARGRLEETLVLGTSDHGESFRDDRPARLESYYEDVTRVPLWVRLPATWLARHPDARARLAEAAERRVSNLDLYATILDVWGRWPPAAGARPALGGASLLRPIDAARTLVVASTGDIHDFRWSNEGFALYHGPWKWQCDERRGCRLFELDDDPGETRDRRAAAPAAELARFRADVLAHPNLRRILLETNGPVP